MEIKLPEPDKEGTFSLERSLALRRSIRQFSNQPLSLDDLAQILWSAQGITHSTGYRTAPSAGALYPLEVYVAGWNVDGLFPGIYLYQPHHHKLVSLREGDFRKQLTASARGQRAILKAPAAIVIAAVYERTTVKYGKRGIRYVHMDAGHAAQNICLQATVLGLGTVPIGAFRDKEVALTLRLPEEEAPLYILPIGMP